MTASDPGSLPEGAGTAADALPARVPVAVLMERVPVSGNRWIDHRWQCAAVLLGDPASASAAPAIIDDGHGRELRIWRGLTLQLWPDEAESYRHNLDGTQPGLFVATRPGADGAPEPFLVSACGDHASALEEMSEAVHRVALPPGLMPWLEAWIAAYWKPEPRRKRQRTDWKEGGGPGPQS